MADGSTVLDSQFVPSPANARAFRDALGRFATGVTIVTIEGPEGPMGFTANSFSSLSMDPPLVLWSVAKSAGRYPYYVAAQHFAIHVLADDQSGLIDRFQRNGAGFAGLDFDLNAHKVPLLTGALARFECELHATHEGGDHKIVVGQVQRVSAAAVTAATAPLVFAMGHMGRFTAA